MSIDAKRDEDTYRLLSRTIEREELPDQTLDSENVVRKPRHKLRLRPGDNRGLILYLLHFILVCTYSLIFVALSRRESDTRSRNDFMDPCESSLLD